MTAGGEEPLLQNEERVYEGAKDSESQQSPNGENNLESKYVRTEAQRSVVTCSFPQEPACIGTVPSGDEREPWSTGLFSCLGSDDDFCSSDMQVCALGTCAPCVLYGSNMERLHPDQATFASYCRGYGGLLVMGCLLFGWNCLAPCFSFRSRIALRRSQNLEGYGEHCVKSVGCCTGFIKSEERRELLDSACDFALHTCCHPCSLCQEGREICRRTMHPAHSSFYYSLAAPSEQKMEYSK